MECWTGCDKRSINQEAFHLFEKVYEIISEQEDHRLLMDVLAYKSIFAKDGRDPLEVKCPLL